MLPLIAIVTGVLCLLVFAARLDVCTQFIPLSVIQASARKLGAETRKGVTGTCSERKR